MKHFLGLMSILWASVASAQARPDSPEEAWHKTMKASQLPRKGCFKAEYPSTEWLEVRCATPPPDPFLIGLGNSYVATVSGSITSAEGSFPQINGLTSAADPNGAFSIQLNTNFFNTPACASSPMPNCIGWQQFIYEQSSQYTGILMQYWLMDYSDPNSPKCPQGWLGYNKSHCFMTAYGQPIPPTQAVNLLNTRFTLTGAAGYGGLDQVVVYTGNGPAAVSGAGYDNVLNLAGHWNWTEFNIYGKSDREHIPKLVET